MQLVLVKESSQEIFSKAYSKAWSKKMLQSKNIQYRELNWDKLAFEHALELALEHVFEYALEKIVLEFALEIASGHASEQVLEKIASEFASELDLEHASEHASDKGRSWSSEVYRSSKEVFRSEIFLLSIVTSKWKIFTHVSTMKVLYGFVCLACLFRIYDFYK